MVNSPRYIMSAIIEPVDSWSLFAALDNKSHTFFFRQFEHLDIYRFAQPIKGYFRLKKYGVLKPCPYDAKSRTLKRCNFETRRGLHKCSHHQNDCSHLVVINTIRHKIIVKIAW